MDNILIVGQRRTCAMPKPRARGPGFLWQQDLFDDARAMGHGGDRQLESSMTISPAEARASARKLCRTLMSAPVPQVRA